MMSQTSAHILLAFSKDFGFKDLFLRKIQILISNIDQYHVSLIQDEKNIGKDYFESIGISVSNLVLKKNQIKKKLKDFSHIVVFWDGEDLTELVFYATLLKKPLKIIPVEITKVRNKDREEPYEVYIGRGTPWGNPFPIGIGGVGDDREQAIKKYEEYFRVEILANPEKQKYLLSLRGYKLGCHCKPLACHGDIIAAYLNSDESIVMIPETQPKI